jgi:lipoate---protein ligase
MQVNESGPQSPEWNMRADEEALSNISPSSLPALRFYEWSVPSATYGYFLNPADYFDQEGMQKHSLVLARRPTGGGVIFHTCDLAFSVIVPANHPFYSLDPLCSYHEINSRVLQAIRQLDLAVSLSDISQGSRGGFCMAKPTQYDLLLEGRKVGGAAQRKTKNGLLHQGSLYLTHPNREFLEDVLKGDGKVAEEMQKGSFPLGHHLKAQLREKLVECFGHTTSFHPVR